jgi:chemotaxis protein histidine kinase CheA
MGVTSVGLLDFYILEASEYVDQLDALVGGAVHAPPDSTPFITAARALRGSSTMAKLIRMAELAGSVERVGRGLRDGSVRWGPEVRLAIVAAVDDIRMLLRTVRSWGAAEEQRAAARVAELRSFVPEGGVVPTSTPISGAVSPTFFASEVEAVAAALDAYVAAPTDRRALDEALGRVRALRGIAALKDLPPLADVADALETAAKSSMVDGRTLGQPLAELYDASAQVLRRAARELRTTGRPDASAPEVRRFGAAAAAVQQQARDEEHVVPVANLFFGDAGPHVVSRADRPPTTLEARFRTEVTSLAEHLRRLVADARGATTAVSRERVGHELRAALRVIRWTIESFGHAGAAQFFSSAATEPNVLDPVVLSSIDAAGALVASPTLALSDLAAKLGELGRANTVDRAIGAGLSPLNQPRRTPQQAPAATSASRAASGLTPAAVRPVRPTPRDASVTRKTPLTPTGPELTQFLQSGLAGFTELDQTPLAPPAPLDDATIVSIDDLLYRGRAALERAIEVRDLIRLSGGNTDEALAELFDLLDLAAAD